MIGLKVRESAWELSMRRQQRLGIVMPSSNTVLEPETAKLIPADGSVTVHVSRVRIVQVSDSASSEQQFDISRMVAAAELLADARVDLILWNGTAASWLGFDYDRRLIEAIEERTAIPATTAVVALNQELAKHGAKRIGLVTPYIASLEAKIVANYGRIGIEITAAERRDLVDNNDYADVSPREILDMIRRVAVSPVDAVIVLCTNLRGSQVAERATGELGIPVLDSVRTAIRHSLARLSHDPG